MCMQGLNTGVMLLNLEKLRQSTETDRLLSLNFSQGAAHKYEFFGVTGDQVGVRDTRKDFKLNVLYKVFIYIAYSLTTCMASYEIGSYVGQVTAKFRYTYV